VAPQSPSARRAKSSSQRSYAKKGLRLVGPCLQTVEVSVTAIALLLVILVHSLDIKDGAIYDGKTEASYCMGVKFFRLIANGAGPISVGSPREPLLQQPSGRRARSIFE